jgi:lipid-binding SYLF domain-containing protein
MNKYTQVLGILMGTMLLGACGVVGPTNSEERELLNKRAQASLEDFKRSDPTLNSFLNKAYGYAVFPRVTSGAFIVGGAAGDGVVYQKGKMVGYADLSQGSVGAQVGGERFAELVIFTTEMTYVNFTHNTFEFDARASAVAVGAGAGSVADYGKGVIVEQLTESGLMVQAALGGQKLRYRDVVP